jgi:hypothetical protein
MEGSGKECEKVKYKLKAWVEIIKGEVPDKLIEPVQRTNKTSDSC